ncbi:MAG: hypothetical protein ACKPHU_08120, partial [Planctomycetaceae bacterium]
TPLVLVLSPPWRTVLVLVLVLENHHRHREEPASPDHATKFDHHASAKQADGSQTTEDTTLDNCKENSPDHHPYHLTPVSFPSRLRGFA